MTTVTHQNKLVCLISRYSTDCLEYDTLLLCFFPQWDLDKQYASKVLMTNLIFLTFSYRLHVGRTLTHHRHHTPTRAVPHYRISSLTDCLHILAATLQVMASLTPVP